MRSRSAHIRRVLLGLSLDEVGFSRRGFRESGRAARLRLEHIGRVFLGGYHAALDNPDAEPLALHLKTFEREERGFAFEGAAMALTLLDLLTPWRRDRLTNFLQGPAAAHVYMGHVGAGWALARLRRPPGPFLTRLDPLLGWLAVDGYGFHQGYFHWRRFVQAQAVPPLAGYALRVFDQGLGRSLWFVEGADVERIAATVAAFSPGRRADLWSGVGLACAYAGGGDREAVGSLRTASGHYLPHLAQGVAFAAKARQRAGNPASHTALACEILCDRSADDAAALADEALRHLPTDGPDLPYEVWRRRIRAHFANRAEGVKRSVLGTRLIAGEASR